MTRHDIRAVTQTAPAMGRRRRSAFTLIELLVVIGIIVLLVTILSPAIGQAVEVARRGKCATNLKAIVHGCQVYAMDGTLHRGSKPGSLPYVTFDQGQWKEPKGNKWCLRLLVDRKLASPEQFICPSLRDYDAATVSVLKNDGFVDKTFGYAFQTHWQEVDLPGGGKEVRPLRLTMRNLNANRVIVGDINPRFVDISVAGNPRSPAHKDGSGDPAGQNVGRWDQSVTFIKDPPVVATGKNTQDKIYESSVPSKDDDGCSRGQPDTNAPYYPPMDDVFLVN
jgi:prepilin-type N-terminal cleavage/methylation domain-containing protein